MKKIIYLFRKYILRKTTTLDSITNYLKANCKELKYNMYKGRWEEHPKKIIDIIEVDKY